MKTILALILLLMLHAERCTGGQMSASVSLTRAGDPNFSVSISIRFPYGSSASYRDSSGNVHAFNQFADGSISIPLTLDPGTYTWTVASSAYAVPWFEPYPPYSPTIDNAFTRHTFSASYAELGNRVEMSGLTVYYAGYNGTYAGPVVGNWNYNQYTYVLDDQHSSPSGNQKYGDLTPKSWT